MIAQPFEATRALQSCIKTMRATLPEAPECHLKLVFSPLLQELPYNS